MNGDPSDDQPGWPARLRPGALRFARASRNYADTVAFYRDLVGLPIIGDFVDSFASDGTIFGLPDPSVQLEIVRTGADDTAGIGDGTDQLVLYLDSVSAVAAATSPLRAAGLHPDPQPHAYWAANGAVTFRDPDGRAIVYAPWVFGRDPDPFDHGSGSPARGEAGPRHDL